MKTKPNTAQLTPAKDVQEFLNGGAESAERAAPTVQKMAAAAGRVHREQKVFRLPLDLINTLKKEAYERSLAAGSRVTETDLVEQAIRAFFRT